MIFEPDFKDPPAPSQQQLDRDFATLSSDESISEARHAADDLFGDDISTDDYEYIKRKLKTDLIFLGSMLGYYDLALLHDHLAHWIQRNRGYRFRGLLLPRGHYKSTMETVLDSIQMALPNVAGLQEHPYTLGRDVTILLAHEVREKAAGFLFEIAAAFAKKPPLLFFFGKEIIPNRREQRFNKWELELPRDRHKKEPTFSTLGMGGSEQGGHYDWLKLDDLIGKEARDSPTIMKNTLDWFDNSKSLLTHPMLDGWTLTGTRWAFGDVYSHAMERYRLDLDESFITCMSEKEKEKHSGGLLRFYARGMIEEGKLIFPEQFTWQDVKILRQNREVWAAQYANNPIEGGLTAFEWPVKHYNINPSTGEIFVFTGEESSPSIRVHPRKLDVCIFCDPSMGEESVSDPTGIVVTGSDTKHNIFILETILQRLKPPELVDLLFKLNNKYHPRVIAIEEVNFSAIYRYWLEEKAQFNKIYLPIRAYKPGSKRKKEARIYGLAHLFSAGQIYCHEGHHDFMDEYEQFPMGKSDHLLDALAQGPDFWDKGLDRNDLEKQQAKVEEIMAARSVWTGY